MSKDEIVEVCVDILRDSGKAFLVSDGDIEVWIPRKWVENRDDINEGDSVVDIRLPFWKAEDLELV